MLNQLTIHNYAIVDSLDLSLKEGTTVITGETGAGKSIMLDALSLTLGSRTDKDLVKNGAERADISANFSLTSNSSAQKWLEEHDLHNEDQECLLRRVITSEGRSRAYINGQQSTLAELKSLGELLIDIHSQHEHQSLLRANTHQRLLDEYCQAQIMASTVHKHASQWKKLKGQLETFKAEASENNAQLELLSYQVQELDELNLSDNELKGLEEEHQRLSHTEETLEKSHQLQELCDKGENFNLLQGTTQSLSLLQQIPYSDQHLIEAGKLIENAQIQLEEASNEINRSIENAELDPERLQEIDERLAKIHELARKHKVNPDQLYSLYQDLKERLTSFSQADTHAEEMEEELEQLQQAYQDAASSLSKKRLKAGSTLQKKINKQLESLGMTGASFALAFSPTNVETPSILGLEKCEFLVSTNPGQPPKPLAKIASGGELSRISLAIQVITAQTSSIPSLVFDEVDVGIGGGVAKTVGELLRELGSKGQVLCVTHQAQVAGQGHQHLFVSKSAQGKTTLTQVDYLGDNERIEEVARMLSGNKLTDQSLAHAKQMMA